MVRLSACLKAVTALTVEMTHKQSDRLISTETEITDCGTFTDSRGTLQSLHPHQPNIACRYSIRPPGDNSTSRFIQIRVSDNFDSLGLTVPCFRY